MIVKEGSDNGNDEIELLALQVQNSNEQSFRKLFEALWDTLYTYAISIVMDSSISKDLTQEVWIDFWQRRKEIEPKNIKGYLYKAIRYKCYNYLRNQKLNTTQLEIAEAIFENSDMEKEEDVIYLSKKIDSILATLPPRCQEIFMLSRIHNIRNKDIAEHLLISQRSVENQISRALKKLRENLDMIPSFLL